MGKRLKIKCVLSAILMIIGIASLIFAFQIGEDNEVKKGFMSGFGTSLLIGSFVLLVKNLSALRNPEKLRKREIKETDERSVAIYTKSMAVTFRISVILEAIIAVGLVCANVEYGAHLGSLIGAQMIIFIICSIIISKKI